MVDDALDDSKSSGRSFRDQLRFKETRIGKLLEGGSIGTVSANGRSVTMQVSGRSYSATDLAAAYRRLIDVYDTSKSDLAITTDDSDLKVGSSELNSITSRMMTQYLREVMGYTNNWMFLIK